MYRAAIPVLLIVATLLCNSVAADPTRPSSTANTTTNAEASVDSKPKLEAILQKNGFRIAVINGNWVTEAHESATLKVLSIGKNHVDIEYNLKGEWHRDTLEMAAGSFAQKSTVKIE